ncbi:MAG TPA: right-handed parallel beta-helix repeat-containing protein, partial [Chitinophagaceae bacterium]|nr:right-handed parallel beta-helix repeat-containing protein [Chitinophagaceae bacterium]
MLMKTILLIILLTGSFAARATTYYVSSEGSDQANGTTITSPWKTLAKINSTVLRQGDQVLFRRGDVFSGKVVLQQSGTSQERIVFGAYGTGNKPVISGFVRVTGWTNIGGGVFQKILDRGESSVLNLVTLDEVPQPMGRYPNKNASNGGYLTVDSHQALSEITDKDLPSSPGLAGAEIVIRKNNYILDRGKVTGHKNKVLQYTGTTAHWPVSDGWGYFIQSHPSTLDQPGEWYFDPETRKLNMFFGEKGPGKSSVNASVHDVVFDVNRKNFITIENLELRGGNECNIRMDITKGLTILNCDIMFSGADGVKGKDVITDFTFKNNTINHSLNGGLNLYGCTNGVITGNNIRNSGMLPGMGRSGDGTYSALNVILCSNMLIEHNELLNTGYIGIAMYGNRITVKNNFVNYFNMVLQDGGGIYVSRYNLGTGDDQRDKFITGNIVLNGYGNNAGTPNPLHADGIYVDDNNSGVIITGNTVADGNGNGIFIHNAHEIQILKNTVYNTGVGVYWSHGNDAPTELIVNNIMTGNILVCKSPSQYFQDLRSYQNDLANFGKIDSNFYLRPETQRPLFTAGYTNPATVVKDYSLSQWKSAFPGRDVNSVHNPLGNFSPNGI